MTTIQSRIAYFENKYGGANAAARFFGIDKAYWSRLKSGKKKNPSKEVLDRLGLVKIVSYVQV